MPFRIPHIDKNGVASGLSSEETRAASDKPPASASPAASEGPLHHVEAHISAAAIVVKRANDLLLIVLSNIEAAVCRSVDDATLLERAGKIAYLASVAAPTVVSPAATAQRIVLGVTGYIANGWKLAHPGAALTERFKADVARGLVNGIGEARRTTPPDPLGTADVHAQIDKVKQHVERGLTAFFAAAISTKPKSDAPAALSSAHRPLWGFQRRS